ncbi:uncharacterized protein LOC120607399 [Pteropus medius]|uniref:uncharacterized protein LOC120607399 n=1 Tax=Pteropus vampyrus TaxID=132908 RepID=UPI00196A587E|nr:uncharacterized protein LOC120607399 [Pteropus giganteus]
MLSPHLPGRAAQPDAPSSYCAPWRRQGGGGASLDTFRVSSLSLGQSPVGPGCKVEGRWRNGRGGEEGVVRKIAATRSAAAAGAAQHSLPHPAPGGPSTLRPTLPLGCSGLSRQDRKRATARGALGKLISKAGVRRAFCFHVLPILFARFPLQSTDPSRPPLNPALAAGDSSTAKPNLQNRSNVQFLLLGKDRGRSLGLSSYTSLLSLTEGRGDSHDHTRVVSTDWKWGTRGFFGASNTVFLDQGTGYTGLDVDNEEIHGVYRSVPETKVISRLIWWGSNDNNISTPIWIKLESPKDKTSLPLCCSLLLQQGEAQPLCPLASDPRLTWPHVTTCLLNADTPECPQSRLLVASVWQLSAKKLERWGRRYTETIKEQICPGRGSPKCAMRS